jgi:hypothetical protein
MTRISIGVLCALLAATTVSTKHTWPDVFSWKPRNGPRQLQARERSFQRVGTFVNYRNNPNLESGTVSEIVATTANGRTLVYTDNALGEIGFIDISNPASPQPGGKLAFPNGHEPTSVAILGNAIALVAVDSSPSFVSPSGYLAVVDLATRAVVRQIDLGGQPDCVTISPDGRYAAVAIENQRDEDVDDGELPQLPAGYLAVIELAGSDPGGWTRHDVDLTNLAGYAPDDPEPEFVDINSGNQAVVTLQENNHIVIVDLATRAVVNHFAAGAVTLDGVDATEDGVISLTETLANVPREPDAVAWVPAPGGRLNLATANEGDLFGGSRGFSIFRPDGQVVFDSGATIDALAVQHGHYPDDRSENKGTEPEAIEYARFGSTDYLFVSSERGGFVAVYELDRNGRPKFEQLLPGPLEPEGLLAIPQRGLLVVSGEADSAVDDDPRGVRSTVMIYQLQRGQPDYPQIVSDERQGEPIAWSALSGMVAVPGQWDKLLGVWDSAYTESRIFHIDVSETPAVITDFTRVQGAGANLDPEGIAIAPDRTLWIASEGTANDARQNLLVHLRSDGTVIEEIGLPPSILACRASTTRRGTLGSGFEGVAVIREGGLDYRLIVAQQRGWDYTTPACEDLDDDGGGFDAAGEPNWTRLWLYDPGTREWGHINWELAPRPANALWVGLSEVSETLWGDYILIERDNRTGTFGQLKTLAKIDRHDAADGIIRRGEKDVFDLKPALTSTNGWITDKPEGVAVTLDGRTFVVTDNDGVDGWAGETWFLPLGHYWRLFR